MNSQPTLVQLSIHDPMPPVEMAWGIETAAPGLLALGGGLAVERLLEAYGQACFPWYSAGQPVMWWSTDPRMVLHTEDFRMHRSLKKQLKQLLHKEQIEIRINHDFEKVIQHCARTPRKGQNGTWIVPDMVHAYVQLHRAGFAHSIETWIQGELVGGLYCVAIGKAVFGESMFSHQSNASKMALAALICLCKQAEVTMIDCQQYTPHLASMGAKTISRHVFLEHVTQVQHSLPVHWNFEPIYWNQLFHDAHHL